MPCVSRRTAILIFYGYSDFSYEKWELFWYFMHEKWELFRYFMIPIFHTTPGLSEVNLGSAAWWTDNVWWVVGAENTVQQASFFNELQLWYNLSECVDHSGDLILVLGVQIWKTRSGNTMVQAIQPINAPYYRSLPHVASNFEILTLYVWNALPTQVTT